MSEYEIGLGLQLLPEVTGYFEEGDISVHLTAELHDGRYICTEITATPTSGGPPGVTLERLRDLRLAEMLERIARVPSCEQQLSTTGRAIIAESNGPTEDVLQVVAATYKYGHALGEAPTREVMSLLGIPRSKAARWISMARTKGFLEETQARIPGGAVSEGQRDQHDLSSLQRQRDLLEDRLTYLTREIGKYRKSERESIGGKNYSEWLKSRIDELERAANQQLEYRDLLHEAIRDLEQAGQNSD